MKIFRFTQLDGGAYSVKIYGRHSTVSSSVSVSESYRGAPVTEVTFGSTLDANFQSLHIPASVERIVFDDTVNKLFAGEISVDEHNPYYCSDGKALYSKDGKTLYRLFPRYIEEYIVKYGTEILDESAFADHQNLKRVVLPEGLQEIKKLCFDRCSGIEELIIPDSVTEIGENPFGYMESLRTLKLPEKIKQLGNTLLHAVTLEELYIPASVERISGSMITAAGTFVGKYTVSTENRFFRSENGIIYSKDMTVLVKAPSTVTSVFEVPESVVSIADRAFSTCTELTEVVFPDGLERIGEHAFDDCPLLDVTIPKSVIDIGAGAFDPLRRITVCDTLKADPAFLFPSLRGDPLEKELIVKSAEMDEVKETIWAYIDFRQNALFEIYQDCFNEKWNFDYDRFDRAFNKINLPFIKTCYAAYRLKKTPEPTARAKKEFTDFLRKNSTRILTERIDCGDLEKFIKLAKFMLTEDNIIEITDYAAKKNAVEFTAFLLDFQNKHFGKRPDRLDLQ